MHASNFRLVVVGNNYAQLDAAIAIALDDHKVRAWKVQDGWFCCYWHKEIDGVHALPFDEGVDSVRHTIKNWLRENPPPNEDEPDIDGTVKPDGWELRSGWSAIREVVHDNQTSNIFYEVLRVRPKWAEYHK